MSDFNAKMHQMANSLSARAPAQTPLEELTALCFTQKIWGGTPMPDPELVLRGPLRAPQNL